MSQGNEEFRLTEFTVRDNTSAQTRQAQALACVHGGGRADPSDIAGIQQRQPRIGHKFGLLT